jgi:hypothetical protein
MGSTVYQQHVSTSFQPTCAATRPDIYQTNCPVSGGELLAAGDCSDFTPEFYEDSSTVDGFDLYRYGPDTANNLFTDVAGDNFSVARVEAQPGGDMIVCGDFNEINGVSARGFAHLQLDGTVDTSFYNSTGIEPFDMQTQPGGKILLAGGGAYTDFQVFGSEQGYVERHYGLPPGGPAISITVQPTPTNQTVYAGDVVDYYVEVSSSSGYAGQWTDNGTNLPGQTSTGLYLETSSTNDSGIYQFTAETTGTCVQVTTSSSNVSLTVLAAPPAPPNDDFVNAYVLTGTSVTTNGYVRSSTLENDESDPNGNDEGHSVWYSWTAPTK